LIVDHTIYWALGNTPFQREAAYKELMRQGLSEAQVQALMQATQKSWLLGSPDFQVEMTKLTERRVMPSKRGRPVKCQVDEEI
jgi:putative transposase